MNNKQLVEVFSVRILYTSPLQRKAQLPLGHRFPYPKPKDTTINTSFELICFSYIMPDLQVSGDGRFTPYAMVIQEFIDLCYKIKAAHWYKGYSHSKIPKTADFFLSGKQNMCLPIRHYNSVDP
jgi:hypothetical protein